MKTTSSRTVFFSSGWFQGSCFEYAWEKEGSRCTSHSISLRNGVGTLLSSQMGFFALPGSLNSIIEGSKIAQDKVLVRKIFSLLNLLPALSFLISLRILCWNWLDMYCLPLGDMPRVFCRNAQRRKGWVF